MSAKYSVTSDDTVTHWHDDQRYVLAEWTTKPFHDFRSRHVRVEHRLVVEYTHGVGVDFRHEVRSDDSHHLGDDWTVAETIEVREHGARHDRSGKAWWLR